MEEKTMCNHSEKPFTLDVVRVKLVKEAPLYSEFPLQGPYEAASIIGESLCEMDREVVCVVNLQSDLKPINVSLVSIGTLDGAVVHPREILKSSILSNAKGIMLIHSHPSGCLLPSEPDIMITDRMIKVCKMIGIDLIDHIIVGGDNREFFSFKEKGLLDNPTLSYATDCRDIDFGGCMVAEKKKTRR